MRDDLTAQEAIFRGDVALDVDEAQDTGWLLVCQQHGGQPAHGMPDAVETSDPALFQDRPRGLHQERYRYFRQVLTGGLPASRRVVGKERPVRKRGLVRDVDVVFLR